MKQKIVIAEYISTGFNLVYDALSLGYEPVLLDCCYVAEEQDAQALRADREKIFQRLPKGLIRIEENSDYDAVLEQVRALDPVLVIAGSEFGVPYATRLADDLGLPGNPASRIKAMTEKDAMHQALKDAGIRYIRGRIISSVEEAEAYYHELGNEQVVVKRVRGAGTQGVYLCANFDEMIAAVKRELACAVQNEGAAVPLLIQERIIGKEYIVNTVSCGGKHRMASLWEYDKVRLSNGTNAYNHVRAIKELDIGHSRLIRYAFDVLDAIGIQYGPVHGEFMLDEKGPVLIEVNCRPMGCGMDRKYVEKIFGHHETDCALESYVNPVKFEADQQKPYRPLRYGAIKTFILPQDIAADSTPVLPITKRLKTFHSALFDRIGRESIIGRTKNLETTGGFVYMVSDDERQLKDELELLHMLEMKYPDILFQTAVPAKTTDIPRADMTEIIRNMKCGGATLVFTDDPRPIAGATVIGESELRNAYDSYENGILDFCNCESFADLEILIQQIYMFTDKIREGGRIIIPESTYCNLPYGIEGMEILLKITGMRIEVPECGLKGVLVASVVK